jgi:hypothetical protein
MGSVFGKQTVAEPPFDLLIERQHVNTSYEIRKYNERFAATCAYADEGGEDDMNAPFSALARYIGVFGPAQNQGDEKISMTAPVVIAGGGTKIDMTAPVVTEGTTDNGKKLMKFMLPVEYDDFSKIPKPLDPSIVIESIPAQTGAVHRYNGAWDEEHNLQIALDLGNQLMNDGVDITKEFVLDHWQFWGYNPPFTLPYFRRNEVWIELGDDQVRSLLDHYSGDASVSNVSLLAAEAQPLFGINISSSCLGIGLLSLGCLVLGVLIIKSRRPQYSRL